MMDIQWGEPCVFVVCNSCRRLHQGTRHGIADIVWDLQEGEEPGPFYHEKVRKNTVANQTPTRLKTIQLAIKKALQDLCEKEEGHRGVMVQQETEAREQLTNEVPKSIFFATWRRVERPLLEPPLSQFDLVRGPLTLREYIQKFEALSSAFGRETALKFLQHVQHDIEFIPGQDADSFYEIFRK